MRTLLAVLAAAAGLTACTPAPAEPVPAGRAPLTAPASPCARAAELIGPAAELARSRMRQLAATPAGPVEPESVRLLADDMLRATMRVRKIVDSSEFSAALIECRATPDDHAEITLLPTFIGVAAVRVEDIRQAARLTEQDRADLGDGVKVITDALTLGPAPV